MHKNTTHGLSKSPTYKTWLKMRERCRNENSNRYHMYGAKGITVCDRWVGSFENFLADMGLRPAGLTLDRKDASLGYFKDNCRWATKKEQARGSAKLLTHAGKTMSIQDWADHLGLKQSTLSMRLNQYGWPLERALTPELKVNQYG